MICLAALAAMPMTQWALGIASLDDIPWTFHLRSALLLAMGAGLGRGHQWAWWTGLLAATWYTFVGVRALTTGRVGELWLVTADPRLTLIIAAGTALADAGFSLLVLPSTRALSRGETPRRRALELLPPVAAVVGVVVVAGLALSRYPVLVDDRANLLSFEERGRITRHHGLLRHDFDIDYRVLIGDNLGDIDRFSAEHFAQSGVGSASDRGRGLLLVLDPAANQIRLEVGYTLEPVSVDAFIA